MSLEPIFRHFGESIVKFAPPFWGLPRVASLLLAMVNRLQELEDEHWGADGLFALYTIDGADDTRLAVLGRIVGQPNQGWNTETYRAVIRGKIRANRSRGLTDDIVEVMRIVPPAEGTVTVFHYVPATMAVMPNFETDADQLVALMYLLPKTRSAGVKMHVFFAPAEAGPYDFTDTGILLDDTTDPGSIDAGLFDVRVL